MGEKETAREVALSGPDTAEAARLNALPPGVPVTGTLATATGDPDETAGEGSPEMKKGTVKFFNEARLSGEPPPGGGGPAEASSIKSSKSNTSD